MFKTSPIGTLPDLEGELVVLSEQRNAEVPYTSKLEDLLFAHGDEADPCSGIEFVRVSSGKGVLKCARCGLRVSLPGKVNTVGELQEYLRSLD